MHVLTAICRFSAFAAFCGLAYAQTALADMERAAANAHQQWFSLASTLDTRVSRLLPCDAAAAAAIEEVHRASTTRLTSLIAYTEAVTEQSAQDIATARQIQKSESDYIAGLAAERADTDEERAGIASQMTNMAESIRKRVSLTAVGDELRELDASVRDRASLVAANATASSAALPNFENLVQALVKREAAMRNQLTLLEKERASWNGYYAARLSRTQVECSGTGQ